jgi:predicted nucleotidyltransferase
MERKVYIKNRERICKGVLTDFKTLPLEKQEIFLKIKETIRGIIGDMSLYVYGSYLHGYWDEESDYDVIIMVPKPNNIDEIIFNKFGIKTNVLFSDKQLSTILIP